MKQISVLGCMIALVFLTFAKRPLETSALYPIVENQRWGFVDAEGRVVVTPQFIFAGDFHEGLASVRIGRTHEFKEGYIDITGRLVIEANLDGSGDFSEGLAVMARGNKYGYIDRNGKSAISPQFEDASAFSQGVALIKSGGRFGFIDKSGEIKIRPQFVIARSFHEGLAAAIILEAGELRTGYIDKTGKWILSPKFTVAGDFSEGLAVVGTGGEAHRGEDQAVLLSGNIKYSVIDGWGPCYFKRIL